ncbi:MAG TPA: response regulator transcription factor [Pseudonocardiaceae bacterium]
MIKVFLVDDHEIVRRGVADLLEEDDQIAVVGEAATVAETLEKLPPANPDLVVLDVRLPDGNGVELCRELRSLYPELHCLILTSYTDEKAMLDAILAGAGGYVIKDIRGTELIDAVRSVGIGRSLLDTRAAAALMARLRAGADRQGPLAGLSEQEQTLLDLIGDGLTNKQIADRMYLAEKTVKNYVSRLLAKLGVERRTQAAVLAAELREQRHHFG